MERLICSRELITQSIFPADTSWPFGPDRIDLGAKARQRVSPVLRGQSGTEVTDIEQAWHVTSFGSQTALGEFDQPRAGSEMER